MKCKLFKDPIYGYIDINSIIVTDVIDSPYFQRLRNIRQTSFAPLYHSAVHTRFMHSLGVYFLAQKAVNVIKPQIKSLIDASEIKISFEKIYNTFQMACLLHDIGHAPFSHAGENFYLAKKDSPSQLPLIYRLMTDLVNDSDFTDHVTNKKIKSAAPHEIVSVIVSLREFPELIPEELKAFFARCITGYKYNKNLDEEKELLNCFVDLLNSSMIDLDKIDYIIRDAYNTGFQSVSIDFNRLIGGFRLVKNEAHYQLAFHKSSLSIIENVIFAHDAERKWIQNHPVILYEHTLINHSIKQIEKHFGNSVLGNKFFSLESLSKEGNDFGEKGFIRLLSDSDIIFNIKNVCGDDLSEEYFSRNNRRHPIWKSEAEYRALFDRKLGHETLDKMESAFQFLEKFTQDNLGTYVIDEQLIEFCQSEKKLLTDNNSLKEKDIETRKNGLDEALKLSHFLQEMANKHNIEFNFIIVFANKFKSGFIKQDLKDLLIKFYDEDRHYFIGDISPILGGNESRDNFFYLYYKRTYDEKGLFQELNVVDIAQDIGKQFV